MTLRCQVVDSTYLSFFIKKNHVQQTHFGTIGMYHHHQKVMCYNVVKKKTLSTTPYFNDVAMN
jgi:hypothetical protein